MCSRYKNLTPSPRVVLYPPLAKKWVDCPTYHLTWSIDLTFKEFIHFQTPEAVYTERDMTALKEQHAEEIQLLQEEYE